MLEQREWGVSERELFEVVGFNRDRALAAHASAANARKSPDRRMSNEELLVALGKRWRAEGGLMARMIAMLVIVEERGLHLEMSCDSIFTFCRRQLGMSEGEAYRRMVATELAGKFPAVLVALRQQRIHLSNLVLLRRLFRKDNVDHLLELAEGKTKRQVEALVAELDPKPDVVEMIRKCPERKVATSVNPPTPSPVDADATSSPGPQAAPSAKPSISNSDGAAISPRRAIPVGAQLSPLSESRHKVQFTASTELREKLERAQALMRHRNIEGDLAVVVERAVDLLIAKLEKEKFAATSRPKPATQPGEADPDKAAGAKKSGNGAIPAAARREVIRRDGEQCAFVSADGERCTARELLELDHRLPRALGGGNDPANLRVLCRAHNKHAAETIFGREHVKRAIDLSQRKRRARQPPAG